jgi:hypothetical protein
MEVKIMTSTQTVVLALLAIVLGSIGVTLALAARRNGLRRRFGPEYDRVASERDSRMAADRELADRRRRHDQLALSTIAPEDRERFTRRWWAIQAYFVDDPARAVVAGDDLMTELLVARGYPVRDRENLIRMLSVDHPRTVGGYRDAHEIVLSARREEAAVEDLRRALVHYRDLFAEIVAAQPDDGSAEAPTVPLSDSAPERRTGPLTNAERTSAAADADRARPRKWEIRMR